MRYSYDTRGNMTSLANYRDSSRNQSFSFDSLNRIRTFNASGLWGTGSYSYSASGNRTNKNIGGVTTNYSYLNNRLSSTSGGETFSFGYNSDGDMTDISFDGLAYDLSSTTGFMIS